jgi:hypothetical protein
MAICMFAQKTTFLRFTTELVQELIDEQATGATMHFAPAELVQISILMDRSLPLVEYMRTVLVHFGAQMPM